MNDLAVVKVPDVIRTIMQNRSFELPGELADDEVYVLPVSGGADSSALAILMCTLFPYVNWRLMFTDTGAEEEALMDTLDALEAYLGRPIERIAATKTLWQLVEGYNNFIPGHESRYCTRELKLAPFRKWLAQFDGCLSYFFVGIRADESSRVAFKIDGVETVKPFVELGLERSDIFRILSETIGIPSYYQRRTRSGCSCCPFQRKSEWIGLLQQRPHEFAKAIPYEKLDEKDVDRYPEAPSLVEETGIAGNWMYLPMPDHDEALAGRHVREADLFGRRLYVGAEFFMDGMPGYGSFIWHQRIVCFSTTLAGVKKQLDGRYQHLLDTGEVYQMMPEDVRRSCRFAVYYLELSSSTLDIDSPQGKSYTWHKGVSLKGLRHAVQWITRTLNAEAMRRESLETAKASTVKEEWVEAAKRGYSAIRNETGSVIQSHWYTPQEKLLVITEDGGEDSEKTLPCPMCTI